MTPHRAFDLGSLLDHVAATHAGRLAVAGERGELTFRQLAAAADGWAQRLRAAGVAPGAHVGLLAANSPDWLAAAFGVWRAGAVLVPVSTFVTARELREILTHADVEILVMQPRLRSHDYVRLLNDFPRPERLRGVLHLHEGERGESPGTPLPRAPVAPESTACVLYTSGTTGRPKGVLLSHRAILATTIPTAERSGLGAGDSLLSTLPLFWVAGLVIRALPTLLTGCALILVESFRVEAVLAALRRYRPSALHWRPPQIAEVIKHPDFDPALLAGVRKGNGRSHWFDGTLSPDARLITGYGMTEMSGYVVALSYEDDDEARRSQFGTLLPGVQMRILDADGRTCPAGTAGEVRVRGPGLFSGYQHERPGTGLDADGWLITGDLGSVGPDGVFRFTGRTKDLLRIKGINVSPLEVETVLAAHPGVEAAYVVGLPPGSLEQRLVALVVPAPEQPADDNALREHAAVSLSHYKRPEAYVFIERADVPMSGTSKPQRAELAELAMRRVATANAARSRSA